MLPQAQADAIGCDGFRLTSTKQVEKVWTQLRRGVIDTKVNPCRTVVLYKIAQSKTFGG